MTDLPTEMQRAIKNAEGMAFSVGVRVFLYQDKEGSPVYRLILPALPDEDLQLVETFEPPKRTVYDSALPPSAQPDPSAS